MLPPEVLADLPESSRPSSVRDLADRPSRSRRWSRRLNLKVKFTGLTHTLGQFQQSLIGICIQTAGPTGKLWVNPVNFRLRAGAGAGAGGQAEGEAPEPEPGSGSYVVGF